MYSNPHSFSDVDECILSYAFSYKDGRRKNRQKGRKNSKMLNVATILIFNFIHFKWDFKAPLITNCQVPGLKHAG